MGGVIYAQYRPNEWSNVFEPLRQGLEQKAQRDFLDKASTKTALINFATGVYKDIIDGNITDPNQIDRSYDMIGSIISNYTGDKDVKGLIDRLATGTTSINAELKKTGLEQGKANVKATQASTRQTEVQTGMTRVQESLLPSPEEANAQRQAELEATKSKTAASYFTMAQAQIENEQRQQQIDAQSNYYNALANKLDFDRTSTGEKPGDMSKHLKDLEATRGVAFYNETSTPISEYLLMWLDKDLTDKDIKNMSRQDVDRYNYLNDKYSLGLNRIEIDDAGLFQFRKVPQFKEKSLPTGTSIPTVSTTQETTETKEKPKVYDEMDAEIEKQFGQGK